MQENVIHLLQNSQRKMHHHDPRSYQHAVVEAGASAREAFQRVIANSQPLGQELIQHITGNIPADRLASTRGLKFGIRGEEITVDYGDGEKPMHRNAIRQIAEKTQKTLRVSNIDEMMKYPWGREMLVDNLHRIFKNIERERVLVRSAQEEVRAVVSDSFLRIDSADILANLLETAGKYGLHVADVKSSPLAWSVSLVMPFIFEPVPNDPVLWGFHVRNSDFGTASFVVEGFLERLWCTNKARRKEYYKRNHLGPQLPDNLLLAQDTLDAQNKFLCLKARDVIDNMLEPKVVDEEMERVRVAATAEIDVKSTMKSLAKTGAVTKGEEEAVVELYNSPDVELLPPATGKGSLWRLSNAFTLFSQQVDDRDRAADLEKIGGGLLDKVRLA